MTWHDIAYKEFHGASRSRSLWALLGFFGILFVGFTGLHTYFGDETFPSYINGLAGLIAVLLPLIGILLGYKAVSDSRNSGSMVLTLSFPHSRQDLAIGTFVGRSLVLLVPTAITLVLAGVLGIVLYGSENIIWFPWFVFITALYGVAFVGVAIGISLFSKADRWITVGSLGAYLLLVIFWDNFNTLSLLVLHRFDFDILLQMPDWALLFRLLKPSEAYYRLLHLGFETPAAIFYVHDGAPFYVDWWAAILVLLAWTIIPVLIGYWRFQRSDL